jgi:hypothetical protein
MPLAMTSSNAGLMPRPMMVGRGGGEYTSNAEPPGLPLSRSVAM